MSLLVYPTDRSAYSRLCRLLSLGKSRAGKGKCHPDGADEECGLRLRRLRDSFHDRAYLALTLRRRPNDPLRLHKLSNLATKMQNVRARRAGGN